MSAYFICGIILCECVVVLSAEQPTDAEGHPVYVQDKASGSGIMRNEKGWLSSASTQDFLFVVSGLICILINEHCLK